MNTHTTPATKFYQSNSALNTFNEERPFIEAIQLYFKRIIPTTRLVQETNTPFEIDKNDLFAY